MVSRFAVSVVAILSIVGLTGCGSDDVAAEPEEVNLIPLEMTDVATGDTVDLDEALRGDGDTPTLAWFWAPHCPTCRGEAPTLDRYAAETAGEVNLVGIGTRDDFALAEDFLESTGVTNFPLLWEPSGESWVNFDVVAQPYLLLLDGTEVVERWPGGVAPEVVQQRLADMAA